MVKIKTKKKLTLPELIQWGWDNKAIGRFEGDKGSLVLFDANSWVVSNKFVCSEETFEVEVEEEITEDTEVPRIVGTYQFENGVIGSNMTRNVSIKEVLYITESLTPLAFYMLNDDMTLSLIWKEGRLID